MLVSAGFDAHVDDPLADMRVSEDGFRELARRCARARDRVAAVLEGGYDLDTLPRLVDAALDGFTHASTERHERLPDGAAVAAVSYPPLPRNA